MNYKVIALSVGGLGKMIFKSGDIVTDESFIPGRAVELVAQKFLEPIHPTEVNFHHGMNEVVKPTIEETTTANAPEIEKKSYDEISVKELRNWLNDNNIEFPSTANKETLFNLYK